MKFVFLVFTFTLLVIACGKNSNSTGKNYCPRRAYEFRNCLHLYASSYGPEYTRDMCQRNVQHVACN